MPRRKFDPAAARQARLDAFMALMPAGLAPAIAAQWQQLGEALADDPPSWSPSPRYRPLILDLCVEEVRSRGYLVAMASANHEVVREPTAQGFRVKANPMVALLEASLKRKRELYGMLEMSPAARRKLSQFDAAA